MMTVLCHPMGIQRSSKSPNIRYFVLFERYFVINNFFFPTFFFFNSNEINIVTYPLEYFVVIEVKLVLLR